MNQEVERFLDLLKNLDHHRGVTFFVCNQPQDLFDRLPEHSAVQKLIIKCEVSDFRFLSRLNHLIRLV